jgi:cytoskeleton protein RodZ
MAPETSPKDPEFVKLVDNPPGGPLRQAREALNYGQIDVARRLNLTVAVINALEENKFSELPEATYVKGYLRSYARLLEIDSDPLLKAYQELVQPEHGFTTSSSSTSNRLQRAVVRWAPIAIAGVLTVMFASWWVNVQPPTPEAVKLEDSQSSEVTETEVMETEALIVEESEPDPEPITAEAEPDVDSAPTSTPAEVVQTEPVVAELGPRPDEQPITEREVAVSITEPPSVQTTPTSTQEFTAEETTPALTQETINELRTETTPGKDQLTMVFSAQSWTEVYDVDENRLLFDLVKSGSVRNLEGTAPFKVRLGNSSGVEISINGRPFNHSQFSRQDNTARFRVDSTSPD